MFTQTLAMFTRNKLHRYEWRVRWVRQKYFQTGKMSIKNNFQYCEIFAYILVEGASAAHTS
jgi:hypothetical protein